MRPGPPKSPLAEPTALDRIAREILAEPEVLRVALENEAAARAAYPLLAWEPKTDFQWAYHRCRARDRWSSGPNSVGKTPLATVENLRLLLGRAACPVSLLPDADRLLWLSERTSVLYRSAVLIPTEDQANHATWRYYEKYTAGYRLRLDRDRKMMLLADPATGRPRAEVWFVSSMKLGAAMEGGEWDTLHIDEEPKDDRIYRAGTVQVMKRRGFVLGSVTAVEACRRGLDTWLVQEVLQPSLDGTLDPKDTAVIWAKDGDQIDVDGLPLPRDEIERTASGLSEWEQEVRIRGRLVPATQYPFFPRPKMRAMREWAAAQPPARVGDVTPGEGQVEFVRRADGFLRVYAEPHPERTYVVGADVAWGVSDPSADFSAACVLERETSTVAAVFHGRIEASRYATALRRIGFWYGTANLAVENNDIGKLVIADLRDYPALFLETENPTALEQAAPHDFGVRSTEHKRHLVLLRLQQWVIDGSLKCADETTLRELEQYGYDSERHRPDHPKAGHDDALFALAYALHAHVSLPLIRRPRAPVGRPIFDRIPGDPYASAVELWHAECLDADQNDRERPEFDPEVYIRRLREAERVPVGPHDLSRLFGSPKRPLRA